MVGYSQFSILCIYYCVKISKLRGSFNYVVVLDFINKMFIVDYDEKNLNFSPARKSWKCSKVFALVIYE